MHVLTFWTPGVSWKGPIKQGLSILLSFSLSFIHCSVCVGIFLKLYHQFFKNFGMVLETYMKLCLMKLNFLDFFFFFFAPKIGRWAPKLASKQRFYNLFKLYYLLCFCSNPRFGQIFVLEIWVKVCSAKQIAGFFDQPYLQNKSMKQPDFLL